ncbi:MAG: deoxyguanosinetriphosphate triphosphohydrolase, partial [Lachnospiraceae bacterium]|nr:deoxyguanosinetriphosphate triphosphohydrolase [Lachnospiraceae bacterium]
GRIMTEADIPGEIRSVLGSNSGERLDTLIHNIITNSMDRDDIIMSPEILKAMQDLRKFMFVNVYTNPAAKSEEAKAEELLGKLFAFYIEHPRELPEQYQDMMAQGEKIQRVVCDYIAGMTDQYAIAKFSEYFVPKAWQVN